MGSNLNPENSFCCEILHCINSKHIVVKFKAACVMMLEYLFFDFAPFGVLSSC